jgi:subtilisin family serine protease
MASKLLTWCVSGFAAYLIGHNSAQAEVKGSYWGRPNMRASIVELIAGSAQPSQVSVPAAGDSLRRAVSEKCGYVDEVYASVLRKRNPSLRSYIASNLQTSRPLATVILPACLYVTRSKFEYTVQDKEQLREVALKFTGYAGPLTRERFAEINRGVGRLKAGQKIQVPYRAKLTELRFPDEGALVQFKRKLADLDSAYHWQRKPAEVFPQSGRAETRPVADNLRECSSPSLKQVAALSCSARGHDYPLSITELSKVFRLYSALKKGPQQQAGVVAIIDTGIAGFENTDLLDAATFPETFRRDDMHVFGSGDDRSIGGSFDTQHPFAARPTPIRAPGYPWQHGTYIAGIVAGKLLPSELRNRIGKRVAIAAYNAVGKNPDEPFCHDLNANYVELGTSRAVNMPPSKGKVINLSLATSRQMQGMLAYFSEKENLFVISAGNFELNLNRNKSYPAAYASNSRVAIVVGAHDGDKKLLKRSAWGSRNVHLAAPGCGIESLSGATLAETQIGNGTSPAAAYVSFVAALVFSHNANRVSGEELDAAAVKKRLLLTADRDLKDAERVKDNATLNAHKAVAVDFDILEEVAGDKVILRYGVLTEGSNAFDLCGESIDLKDLARLDLRSLPDKQTAATIEYQQEGAPELRTCELRGGVEFAHYGSDDVLQAPRKIPWANIRQIITTPFPNVREEQRLQLPN